MSATSAQLDGTLSAVTKEISRLHGEILSAARTSLTKAIRIGELLDRVRASRKGKWLVWLKDNAPFSDKTARNYIHCFKRRAELKLENVSNLSDAYALLTAGSTQRESVKEHRLNVGDNPNSQKPAPVIPPEEQAKPRPQRRRKSRDGIMDAISSENLERGLKQSQIGIDKLFTDTLAQISRQDHAVWAEFPMRLMAHGQALIEQGERLELL
jgi:hypothetical protein